MKNVYKTWPKSFIAGLDYIRHRDSIVLSHPIYTRRTTELFQTLSSEITKLAATGPNKDFATITRDSLYDYHRKGLCGDSSMDFIVTTAKKVCDSLRVSEVFYDIEALSFCLLVLQGEDDYAVRYLHRLLRPAVMLYRIRDSAHFTGMRGGKPRHKLYSEAMDLANDYIREHPATTYSNVAYNVRRKLLVNNLRVPAERTIREWLSNF